MDFTTPEGEVFSTYIVGHEQATKGILIIHDWWGLLDYNREWADRFAAAGYRAMVIDLYNGRHPVDTKEAGDFVRTLDQEVVDRKIKTALQALQMPQRKIAVLGWSFGGVQAQHAILQNPEWVNAMVLYYCRIILDKSKATPLNGPILAILAETERTWPDRQAALEHIMSEAKKVLECHSYDADHGFVNPDSLRYDSEATESAWQVTLAFLNKHLV
ncbi:MAG: hypothetical protein BWK79_01665 [Beggiatoa sp. IS2]|nr:MAG: hypothetical protein BWK79_01665 [Beggiatoa sp. IS2]